MVVGDRKNKFTTATSFGIDEERGMPSKMKYKSYFL